MQGIPASSCQPNSDSVSQCRENKFGAREIHSLFNLKFIEIFQAVAVTVVCVCLNLEFGWEIITYTNLNIDMYDVEYLLCQRSSAP
jgi:hypothetical protein